MADSGAARVEIEVRVRIELGGIAREVKMQGSVPREEGADFEASCKVLASALHEEALGALDAVVSNK